MTRDARRTRRAPTGIATAIVCACVAVSCGEDKPQAPAQTPPSTTPGTKAAPGTNVPVIPTPVMPTPEVPAFDPSSAPPRACEMLKLGMCGLCGSSSIACTTFAAQAANPAMETEAARARCVSTLQRMSPLTLQPDNKARFCATDFSSP